MKKTIHFFGDSWTKGEGCQFEPGRGVIPSSVKFGGIDYSSEFKKHSTPGQIGAIFNDEYRISNRGTSGSSNFQIYREVLKNIGTNNGIKQGELVVVTWSSIVRDPLQFLLLFQDERNFLNSTGIENSIKGFLSPNTFLPNWLGNSGDEIKRKISRKVYDDYVVDRMNFKLLHEFTMNYICNLQIIFEEIGVEYLFINAFENVLSKDVEFYHKVKKEKWILFDSTLSDYLCDIEENLDLDKGYSIWEDDFIKPGRNMDGPHPNRIGYGYLAELISKEIIERGLL